ncbi:hypothetical protein L1987_55291 [Smallanthus sonchifolius]|uniref:Uncharacterized protein n=1 Tax=Smallanthus sonchifolius TaxID=185202 RepID=A0ACB9E9G5_9ASTR|nr:hypothetical protein L1987_55291 [Smallanthus sonchifolius]
MYSDYCGHLLKGARLTRDGNLGKFRSQVPGGVCFLSLGLKVFVNMLRSFSLAVNLMLERHESSSCPICYEAWTIGQEHQFWCFFSFLGFFLNTLHLNERGYSARLFMRLGFELFKLYTCELCS